MKYIFSFIVASLLLFSCKKEVIVPNGQVETPVSNGTEKSTLEEGGSGIDGSNVLNITDPNKDPDLTRKKKR